MVEAACAHVLSWLHQSDCQQVPSMRLLLCDGHQMLLFLSEIAGAGAALVVSHLRRTCAGCRRKLDGIHPLWG